MKIYTFLLSILLLSIVQNAQNFKPTESDSSWFLLSRTEIPDTPHHINHYWKYKDRIDGYNLYVLKGIDITQSSALDGGGYFIGINANPTESPIGYCLSFLGKRLLEPPRNSSYCSGATYAAFIEAMNLIFNDSSKIISNLYFEALRMQEPDGGRREDHTKFWGKWNADGFGSHFALVQYSKIGIEVNPKFLMPGDFVNISWKNGIGHSVIFLGWYEDETYNLHMLYWSSQKGTNGLGDQLVPVNSIKEIKAVRILNPENLFSFDLNNEVETKLKGDKIIYQK